MKKDDLSEFHLVKLDEKEELVNYLNYHKIFYILTIEIPLLCHSQSENEVFLSFLFVK